MKYSKKIVKMMLDMFRSDTYTITEVCMRIGISTKTNRLWLSEHPDLAEEVDKAKDERMQYFVAEAKKSLLKKIQGYTVDETKVVTIPSNEKEVGKDGKMHPKPKIKEQTTVKKHIQADTAAIIFTLTNGEPDVWKNHQTNEVTGKDGKDLFKDMSDDELQARIKELERKLE